MKTNLLKRVMGLFLILIFSSCVKMNISNSYAAKFDENNFLNWYLYQTALTEQENNIHECWKCKVWPMYHTMEKW